MYKQDLVLNNLRCLICNKTKPNLPFTFRKILTKNVGIRYLPSSYQSMRTSQEMC